MESSKLKQQLIWQAQINTMVKTIGNTVFWKKNKSSQFQIYVDASLVTTVLQ